MAVVGFRYRDDRVVCYDCFADEEEDETKITGFVTDRDAKFQAYFCDKCGRSIA